MNVLNRNKLLATATTLMLGASMLAFSPAANAYDGPPHGEHDQRHQQRQEAMFKELGLTEQQQSQLKTIKEQGRQNSKTIHQNVKSKRQALMDYMASPEASEAKAKSMNQEIGDLMHQMSEQRISSVFQMKDILTPEQFTQLMEKKKQHMEQRKNNRGNRRGPRQDGNRRGQ